jgi:hypothetical protein
LPPNRCILHPLSHWPACLYNFGVIYREKSCGTFPPYGVYIQTNWLETCNFPSKELYVFSLPLALVFVVAIPSLPFFYAEVWSLLRKLQVLRWSHAGAVVLSCAINLPSLTRVNPLLPPSYNIMHSRNFKDKLRKHKKRMYPRFIS